MASAGSRLAVQSPATKRSSATAISSAATAVSAPRLPHETPSTGAPTGAAARSAERTVPSPPSDTTRSPGASSPSGATRRSDLADDRAVAAAPRRCSSAHARNAVSAPSIGRVGCTTSARRCGLTWIATAQTLRPDATVAAMEDAASARAAIRRGEWTGPTAGLAPGYTQANLVDAPGGRRVRLPALLRAQPEALPGARGHRPRLAGAGGDRARRRPAHRRPALPRLPRRRARRRADRRARRVARRPRRVPDRLLVHVRARAARRGPAGPPRRAGRQRADVPHAPRLPSRRPFRRPARRLDAPDDARAGDPRDADHQPLPDRPRRAGPRRRPRRRSASPTWRSPTTASPWRSAPARSPCSGPAA